MLKKFLACCVVSLFVMGGVAGYVLAVDPGPADITMTDATSAKPKPAQFPHKAHQDAFGCAECHHSMDADGKKVDYVDGQAIGKCADCHNADKLAGRMMDKLDLGTLKGAGHGNCLECHKAMAKEKPELAERKIDKCAACHPKS